MDKKVKVYKIYSSLGDKIYIGSTFEKYLCQRMGKHRSSYKLYKEGNKNYYTTSFILFDEYGLENCKIELLEEKETNSVDEKNKLEGKYIREIDCVNKCISGRTQKEYKNEKKEEIKEQQSKKCICECGSEFRWGEKARHLKTKKHLFFIEN